MEYRFINTEYLESVTGGDKEILSELIGIFRTQVVEISAQMKSFCLKKDYHSLGMLAHKAKSSVAIMGMNDLASVLKTLEHDAKEGKNSENYSGCIERYDNDTYEAILELENYINNL